MFKKYSPAVLHYFTPKNCWFLVQASFSTQNTLGVQCRLLFSQKSEGPPMGGPRPYRPGIGFRCEAPKPNALRRPNFWGSVLGVGGRPSLPWVVLKRSLVQGQASQNRKRLIPNWRLAQFVCVCVLCPLSHHFQHTLSHIVFLFFNLFKFEFEI